MTRTGRSASTVVCDGNQLEKSTRNLRCRRYVPMVDLLSSSDSEEELYNIEPLPRTLRKQKSKNSPDEKQLTPSKQKKSNDENLPSPPTPSSLLGTLELNSPKKKCNPENEKQIIVNKKLFGNTYQKARKALHSTLPSNLPGREKELEFLRNFILTHLCNESSRSLYISGPPGTGKTASLSLILEEDNIASEFHTVYVNCTSIKSSGLVYSRIVKELKITSKGKTEKDNLSAIEKYLLKTSKMVLLVLDEIDQLDSKKQSILYSIFEWPSIPNAKIILIGIANSLDLTDRILPRLQARCELKPELMHFASYSKQQIVDILTKRLEEAGALSIFAPVALQMLAGKVAAVSGDVRRALDIGRRVIELAEQNKNEALKSIENLTNGIEKLGPQTKTVDMKQVMNVLSNVYGAAQNLNEDVEDSFPLQQKIMICSLLLILKKSKNKDVTIGRLHDVYRRVCVKRNLLAVDQAEFVGLCSLVETRGIVRISGKKEPRLHKVTLEWDEEEVGAALKDKQLMSMILQDESCLGKK